MENEETAPVSPAAAEDAISESPDTSGDTTAVEELAVASTIGEEAAVQQPSLGALEEQIGALSTKIGEHVALARHREQTISRLHDEIQELRKGELSQALAPLFRDLIRLYDDLVVAEHENRGLTDAAKTFAYFHNEVLEILARHDVEPFDLQPGDRFDPTQHRAVRAVASEDAELDRCVETVHRRGFRRGARVFRVAEVTVYRSEPRPTNVATTVHEESSAKGEES